MAPQLGPLPHTLSYCPVVEGTGWPGTFLKEITQDNIGIVSSQVTGILSPAKVTT